MPAIAFDATPLTSFPGAFGGHAVRGIGRYVTSVLRSLSAEQADWADENLLLVRTTDVDAAWWPGEQLTTRRIRVRPQDVGWWTSPVLDRMALGRRRPDAWTTTDPTAPLAPPGSGKSVVFAYDLIPLEDRRAWANMRAHRRIAYRLYLRRLKQADVVVAISHAVAIELTARLNIPGDRVHVVYPGLIAPPARAAAPDQAARDLLFVGVPAAHKNPGSAVAALSELRRRGHDVRLRFVGTHFPQARRQLDDQAARDGVASYVDYLGQVDEERLQDLYASSLLLAPSTHEGLGLGPIEALLAGGRVVCGTAPVFRETVGDLASYADPQDPADLADACERACATTLPEQELAALAKRFSSAACASAAVAAFERLRSSPAK